MRTLLPIATRNETAVLAWRLLGERRRALTVAGAAFVGAGICSVVPPWLLGRVVDAVRDGDAGSTVTYAAVGLAVASVLAGLLTALATAYLARATEPALAALREQVLANALDLDLADLEESGTGDLLSRVGDDVRSVGSSLVEAVPLMLSSALAVLFTVAGLFTLDWRLGLAGLAVAPFYVRSLRWYLPRSAPRYAEERVAQGERAEALVTGLQASATLRAYAREDHQLSHVAEASDGARQIAISVFALLTRFFARNNRAELIGLGLILGTGFLLVREDAATVGAVTAAALYFHRLFDPIGGLLYLFDDVQSAGASLARLAGIAQLPPPVPPTGAPAGPGVLEVSSVGHAYVPGHPVLHDIVVRLEPGEHVALVGESGAGKTTLGAIVAGTVVPTSGAVTFGGVALDRLDVREHVLLVTQEVHVFSGTLRDNVTLVAPGAGDAAVSRSLDAVGAGAWLVALPDGLDTRVGEGGTPITADQAQQVALARVLLRDPAVVVLDEAAAEAGSIGQRRLEAAAAAAVAGRSALVIAHRLTQSAAADRVVVMDRGRIVEQGSHDALVAAGGRYAELWRAWSS
ncbi:MAG: multidrug transporter permease [Marmoricola sp.]|nr:multidrug transporter permease [Marmoricola sp.]